ncbi:MAG TPA: hypothetical protein VKZ71_00905 [Burkholderiaceae bacterium]|nr:hypothetical protein [Burkholderiaceae bacterium]
MSPHASSLAPSGAKHAKQAVSLQTALVLETDEVRTLTEIGFLAAGNGFFDEACRIFNALKLIRPDRAFPLVGLAVAHLNAGHTTQAVALLENTQLTDPAEQAVCNTWRGFALQQAGHQHAAHTLLQAVIAAGQAPSDAPGRPSADALALAQALLQRNAGDMARPNIGAATASLTTTPGDHT